MEAMMRRGSDDQETSYQQPEMYTAASSPESPSESAVSFASEVAFFLCAVAFGFVVMASIF